MSEKTVLNRLTIIENYVKGIFCKVTTSLQSLNSLTQVLTPALVTTPLTYETVGGDIIYVDNTPTSIYVSTLSISELPLLGLKYPQLNENLVAYGRLGNFFSTGLITELTINNLQAITTATLACPFSGSLIKLNLPDLKYWLATSGTSCTLSTGTPFVEFNAPLLEFIGGSFSVSATSPVTSFSMPSLKVLNGVLTINNAALQTLDFPEVLVIRISDATNSAIQTINLPKVKFVGSSGSVGISLTGTKSSLTSIQLPVVEYCSSITFPTTSTSLTTFTFGSSLKFYGSTPTTGNFITTSNALNQASVDNILISLANLDGTNGTTAFSTRTVTITGTSATPSAAGLVAKATLVSRGCTVTTN